ncbi:Holliday junction resolvase RuvX [Gemmatimonadota bacterium]
MSRVLALDYGERRLGMAVGDTDIGVASGLSTIIHAGRKDLRRQLEAVVENEAPELILVGYPLQMDGSRGERCEAVDAFARFLTGWFGLPLVLRDERLTSAEAERIRKKAGRTGKEARENGLVDRAAAILILQNWFDSSDRSGLTPGPVSAGGEDEIR